MFLLDTVTVSELRKGSDRMNDGVRGWNDATRADLTFISVVTLRELRTGALLVARRDAQSGAVLNEWIDRLVRAYGGRVLDVGEEVAEACAALHVPDPMPSEDAWLAATALVHGLTLVTRNSKDYERTPAAILNPWTET